MSNTTYEESEVKVIKTTVKYLNTVQEIRYSIQCNEIEEFSITEEKLKEILYG